MPADLVLPPGARCLPKVKEVVPFGSQILVEKLELKDIMDTTLQLVEGKKDEVPEGIVLAMGGKLPADCGLSIGDRILIHGTVYELPDQVRYGNGGRRKWGLIEFHQIKAVLKEATFEED